MRNWPMLIFFALLFVLALGSVEADVGWGNSLAVFQSWEDKDYKVGDEVFVDIEVYNKTLAYDPNKVECELGFIFTREVTVKRLGAGLYRANFTILESDGSTLWINVWVLEGEDILSGDYVLSLAFLELADEYVERMIVEVVVPDPEDRYPVPGQVVEFEATVLFDGSLVDADAGTIACAIGTQEGTIQRVSPGRYSGSCTVPAGLKHGDTTDLEVVAAYTSDPYQYSAYHDYELYVEFFSVWVNVREANERWAELDFYVTDGEGDPIQGAEVSFWVSYYNTDLEYKSSHRDGTTDANGKATFNIGFYDLYSRFVSMDGYVENGTGYRQYFESRIDTTEPTDRTHYSTGLSVHRLNEIPVKKGTTVQLDHEVYWDDEPFANGVIYIYISDERGLHLKGKLTTDDEGLFSIAFTTPEARDYWELMTIEYQAESGGVWDYDSEALVYGIEDLRDLMDDHYHASTTLDVSTVQQGEMATVTLDDPAADGEGESAWIIWSVGPIDHWETYVSSAVDPAPPGPIGAPEWSPWFAAEHDHVRVVPCTWDGDAYVASFPIPMFIPTMETIFVLGKLSFRDGTVPDFRTVLIEGLEVKAFNNPPTVGVVTPVHDGTYGGELVMTGTSADDVSVELVELRIDGGEWTPLEGTTSWSYQVNTTTLERGPHVLEARAFDGDKYSVVKKIIFYVDQPPSVVISSPPSGGLYHTSFEAKGIAFDDGEVTQVTYRLNNGPWMYTQGIRQWTVTLNLTELKSGPWVLEVRSYDGIHHSQVASVSFLLDRPPTVSVTRPGEGDVLNGTVEFAGRSYDDILVKNVSLRIDRGPWIEPTGRVSWRYSIDTVTLDHGDHLLEVRSDDGNVDSQIVRVQFSVDQPPVLGETNLDTEASYNGEVEVSGTASDDHQVVLVQVRIDSGLWQNASGSLFWTYSLDTTKLEVGQHRFEARAFDGIYRSTIIRVEFSVDQPPTVTIVYPLEGSQHEGVMLVSGDFHDDKGVRKVELRVDGGEWIDATVKSNWTHILVLEGLDPGEHSVEARSYDGHQYSTVASVHFFVEGPVDDPNGPGGPEVEESPGFPSAYTVICMVIAVGVISGRRRRR